jgi:hypothetical protein
MRPIQIFAGSHALKYIQENGLKPADIRVIMGASGGPKWFVLSHLDRYLIQHWLPEIPHQLELIGSSIGAWRMSAYASDRAMNAIEHLEHEYLNQRYSGKPTAREISQSVHDLLDGFMRLEDVQGHKQKKLHIVSARTKWMTKFEQKHIQTAAFAAVASGNLLSRQTLPFWFDRVVFHSEGAQLPIQQWDRFETAHVTLNEHNYRDALLSSGAIPVVIEGVSNPHNAPKGMYRDGGMVDYHFDLPIKPKDGLVLYPHFAPNLKPGWFDKPLKWRKVQAENYSHTVVVCPSREFVESLPYAKIPDRKDFERLDNDTRIQYWQTVIDRNKAIAEAFDDWVNNPNQIDHVEPITALAKP